MKLSRIPLSALAACFVVVLAGAGAADVFIGTSLPKTPVGIEQFIAMKRTQAVAHTDDRWTLIAAGDVMLSRFVATVMKKEDSVHYPYDRIRGIVASADIAFANLENPVGPGGPMPESGLRFRASIESLDGLRNAGFDIVSLANNHQSDVGQAAIGATLEYVKNAGLLSVGAGVNEADARKPVYMDIKGKHIAFLAYGDARFKNQVHFATDTKPGIALGDPEHMKADIAAARANSDLVIVSLHAGAEYREMPDSVQLELVRAAVEAGAHIVLGHHPHVIQPIEQLGETWVMYSMGNLVFDQAWSTETSRGMMMKFLMEGSDIREIEAIPVDISARAQPSIAEGNAQETSLTRLEHPLYPATVIQWPARTLSGTDGDGPESAAIISNRAMPLQQISHQQFTIEKTLSDNINGNRMGETYALKNGRVTIEEDGFPFWESPTHWWVQDMHLADLDGDHEKEMILSVWKNSSERSKKSSWIGSSNSMNVRNYVYVYTIDGGNVSTMWQSADLAQPYCEIATADLDGDGISELMSLEGNYSADASCNAHTMNIWKWNNAGLYSEWTSEPGSYWNIRTELGEKGQLVIVDGSAL